MIGGCNGEQNRSRLSVNFINSNNLQMEVELDVLDHVKNYSEIITAGSGVHYVHRVGGGPSVWTLLSPTAEIEPHVRHGGWGPKRTSHRGPSGQEV